MINKKNILNKLPGQPGCYLFYNNKNEILYIGKANNLKSRVRSYFAKNADLSPAKQQMVAEIDNIDYITVRTEEEAFLLEANLIKKHQPAYNVILKDDKFFQYIKITNETFPRIITARKISNDGAKYFGPYSSGLAVKQILKFLKKIFPYRSTKQYDFVFDVLKAKETLSANEYKKNLKQIEQILKGKTNIVSGILQKKMQAASQNKHYEQAAYFRDQLANLKKLTSLQQAIIPQPLDVDVVNWVEYKNKIYLALIKIRQGKLIDKLNVDFDNIHESPQEIIISFIRQYYIFLSDQPKTLILPVKIKLPVSEQKIIFAKNINLKTPQRGKLKKLLQLAKINAEEFAKKSQVSFMAAYDLKSALANLKKKLKLRKFPRRIECYDISNIQGKHAVGAMIVFQNGRPDKSQYRKFTIKHTVGQPNDFAMMSEIIARRLQHTNWPKPDLIIIDGGKGQLSIVHKTLESAEIKIPIISLAKKQEKVFVPNIKNPIKLRQTSPEFFLIQRIRDEAHRFAINFYRLKHKKSYLKNT